MSEKHVLEQLRERFVEQVNALELVSPIHNDVIAKLDRAINQVLMGVEVGPTPKALTRGQKAARTRAANKRKTAEADVDPGEE